MNPKQRKEINLKLIIIICICITLIIITLLTKDKEPSITYKLLQEARKEVYILHRKIDSLENERRQ